MRLLPAPTNCPHRPTVKPSDVHLQESNRPSGHCGVCCFERLFEPAYKGSRLSGLLHSIIRGTSGRSTSAARQKFGQL